MGWSMKCIAGIAGASLFAVLLAPIAEAQVRMAKSECQGPYKGIRLTQQQLQKIAGSAKLADKNFCRADLSGANLNGANLSNATLGCANLSGANLRGAHLRGAYLSGANLRGANLSNATFEPENPPAAQRMAFALGLSHMIYTMTPIAMVTVREE